MCIWVLTFKHLIGPFLYNSLSHPNNPMRQVLFSYFTTEDVKPEKNTGGLSNSIETEISKQETMYGLVFLQKSVLFI